MAARAGVIIAGESQCLLCSQVCLVADHLAQNLPNFCYETIIKPVSEWEIWLRVINSKHKWHHRSSPLVWKELLLKGSKQYYIGGASEFWEYCHAYYNFDAFISEKVFNNLENGVQYINKLKAIKQQQDESGLEIQNVENGFVICISGAGHESTQQLISGILDISDASNSKKVSKIYLYDDSDVYGTSKAIEKDCNYIGTHFPSRVVKAIDKLGSGLVGADLLIVMDHVPRCKELKIDDWLDMNYQKMKTLAKILEMAASPKTRIVFPNFGPSCFNATVLLKATNNHKNNIVVCTSDLGLEALVPASEIAGIPLQTLFCPPVWGFVGINQIVDIQTTYHKYYSFYPYERIVKTRDSTLKIGTLTPEIRNLEYLMLWDRSLWLNVSERKKRQYNSYVHTIEALVGTIKLWFFDNSLNKFTNMGVACDGSFGLTLDGIFSQPVQLIDGHWIPAANLFPMPRDPYIKVYYFEKIARELIENHITKKISKERYAKTLIDEKIDKSVSLISFTYDIVDELVDGHIVSKWVVNEIINEAVLISFNNLVLSIQGIISDLTDENISDGSLGNVEDNFVDILEPSGRIKGPIDENISVSSQNVEKTPEQLIKDNMSEMSLEYQIENSDETLFNQSSLSQETGISDNSSEFYSENDSNNEV